MKSKRVLSGILVLGMICCLLATMVLAAPAQCTEAYADFVWLPVKQGADAAGLFSKANTSDATEITTNADNSVTIIFPAGTETEGAVTRTATSVNLDMSAVYENRYNYVSFDLTANDLMDLVASMDIDGATGDVRPLSLYLADNGYFGGMPHSQSSNYIAGVETKIATLKNSMAGWFFNNKYTVQYAENEKHNVKMVHDLKTNNVWIYIDGVMRGQNKYTTPSAITYNLWKRDLMFTHYATVAEEQSLVLENIEVGVCEEVGYKGGINLQTTDPTTYWFPNNSYSDRVFIRLTMPAESDKYIIAPSTGHSNGMMGWCGSFGTCHTWDYNTTIGRTGYDQVNGYKNVSCWEQEGKTDVVVTFDLDRTNKVLRVFTNNGGYHEKTYTTDAPTYVKITCETSTTGEGDEAVTEYKALPTLVEYGVVLPIGLNISNDNCDIMESFDDTTEGRINVMTFGQAESGQKLVALYAWYDSNDICVKADAREIAADENGLYYLSGGNTFGSTVPEGAVKMRAFLWNGLGTLSPVWDDAMIEKTAAEDIVEQ